MKKLVFIALIFISCSTRYTRLGDIQKVSEDKETLSYNVSKISEPSPNSPYLGFTIEEKTRIIEKYKEKVKVKKSPNFFTFTPLLGVAPGFMLRNKGYVGLGETIIGLSVLTVASVVGFTGILPEHIKWETITKDYVKEVVPYDKKFSLLLEDKNYSLDYTPDKTGKLKISILDFTPYYEKGRNFNFALIAPGGGKLKVYRFKLGVFHPFFQRKKE